MTRKDNAMDYNSPRIPAPKETKAKAKSLTSGQGLLLALCVVSGLVAIAEPMVSIQASVVFAAAFVSIFLLEILRAIQK